MEKVTVMYAALTSLVEKQGKNMRNALHNIHKYEVHTGHYEKLAL